MKEFTLQDIMAGWRQAGEDAEIGPLLGGSLVPDVDILVETERSARSPATREVLGEPRLVWVPREALRPGPHGGLAVVTSPMRFSGANRHRRGTMRTMTLFRKLRHDEVALEKAAVLAALVGARNVRKDLADCTLCAVTSLVGELGFDCVQDIWARSSSAPMPVAIPVALERFQVTASGASALGRRLRQWHDIAFRKLAPVKATPVRHGFCALRLTDFEDVVGRYAEGLNKAHGEVCWKTISREDLESAVWSNPRTHLMESYGVSDVAITKRCRKWGISIPPRGYWQRLDAHVDPRPLLDKSGVEAPQKTLLEIAVRFDRALCD